jgi:hypothetical protein
MIIRRQPIWRPCFLIFIEFPAVAAVGVPLDAVAGKMQSLLGRQPLVVSAGPTDDVIISFFGA